jgi:hypothetical protein
LDDAHAPYHTKALPLGTTLREWRLERVLGAGGFGIVYQGRGTYFDELVAIKEYFPSSVCDRVEDETVKPMDSSSEEIYALGLQKFVEEAKVLWNLSKPERHPNIVSVKSLFELHGTAYMVMDFEQGVSLSDMLKQGKKFDEKSLLAIVKPIADGLDRAHKQGVVHRDIKPANILVDETGRPVLFDFGSARFDAGQATNTKVTFYTPPYASLEQYVKTYPQGAWTDVYAMGVVLYQCVTGEKPPEVLERLHGGLGEPLAGKKRKGFSETFLRAVDAAMGIRPDDRPRSMPEWIALFDAPAAVAAPVEDDDRTRIHVAAAPAASAAEPKAAAPKPKPAAPAAQPAASAAAEEAKPGFSLGSLFNSRNRAVLLGGAAVVFLGAAAAAVLMKPAAGGRGAARGAAAPPIGVLGGAGQANGAIAASANLLSDAQSANRPKAEISALTAADEKIRGLGGDLAKAKDTAKKHDLNAQIDAAASDMARAETKALERAGQSASREIDELAKGSTPDGAKAVSAVRQARDALTAANGQAAKDEGAAAIGDARKALTAYGDLTKAAASAAPLLIPAKRAKVAQAVAEAKSVADAIARQAGGAKPWLFASQARKQAYQTLQSAAASAKSEAQQLDDIARRAASASDPKALDSALGQAQAAKRSLNALYASSSAAAQVK